MPHLLLLINFSAFFPPYHFASLSDAKLIKRHAMIVGKSSIF